MSGQMSVDAQVSRAALRVTGTLHSSSALKARVSLDRGRVLSMELDVPEDKMELLDIRWVMSQLGSVMFGLLCVHCVMFVDGMSVVCHFRL